MCKVVLLLARTILFFLFFNLNNYVKCVNILGLMGLCSPSHHLWNSFLLHSLADRGHNVTILSVDLPKSHQKVPKNVHYIHLEKAYDIYKSNDNDNNDIHVDISNYIGVNSYQTVYNLYDFGLRTCKEIVKSKGMQTLLNYPNNFQFDLIIYDYSAGPMLLGFAHKFNYPPIVGVSPFHNPPITIDSMSNHYFPAYVPYYSTSYTSKMNFWQRLHNTMIFTIDTIYRRYYFNPKIDAIMRPYFKKDMPLLTDIEKKTAIALVNSHPSVNYAESLPPNVIEVGGMQMQEVNSLSEELDSFIKNGTHGTLLFSLGTNFKSEHTSIDKIEAILESFNRFPKYNFIWKFDMKFLKKNKKSIPKNVMVKSFLPQKDILSHPNLKAFITHCGGLSIQEATWYGVPIVGIPLFFDQHRNIREALLAGIVEEVDYMTMTADSLSDAIKRVLENKNMIKNAKERSARFCNRPMLPRDTAIWWIEYLLRESNLSYLKSPAANLSFFEAHSLDVLSFVLSLFIAIGFTFYRCFI